ncbi:MAG: 30S ribosome-binding factor RbfA [Bifidobacteriaceae bacterium]|jgi:ribosome-binding factor A|nr:30S ribosome-binding factor RbfA [Bifidobacteriaceae bacterium]
MAESPRVRRVADRVREVVAELLSGRIKDPRLGFVTITDVRVTGDLHHATVFYTVLGDDAARAATAEALASARGLIRSEVGKALGLRLTPSIEFQLDELPDGVGRIEDALRQAAARDAAVAALASAATYAGDPDPYRHPSDDDAADSDDDAADADADSDDDADSGDADADGPADAGQPEDDDDDVQPIRFGV